MALPGDGDFTFESSYSSDQFSNRIDLMSRYGISNRYRFQSLHEFKQICMEFYEALMEGMRRKRILTQYLGFTHVKMADIDNIDQLRDESELPSLTILYDHEEEILIMKFSAGPSQEICVGTLSSLFLRVTEIRTGEMFTLIPMLSSRCKGARISKEGDAGFKPSTWVKETDWPSLQFEVGVSESLPQLRLHAKHWIEGSGGKTCVVIIVSIDKVGKSMFIERWQDDPMAVAANPIRRQPARTVNIQSPYGRHRVGGCMQSLTLDADVVYNGASLSILVDLVYDVMPVVPGPPLGPGDFEITADLLNRFNIAYWGAIQNND